MEELIYVKHGEGITLVARLMKGDYCLSTGAATFPDVSEAVSFQRDREERLIRLVEQTVSLEPEPKEGGYEPS